MKWSDYASKLIEEAIKLDYTKEAIDEYLSYAEHLHRAKLPIIFDQIHLSFLVGYKYEYLLGVSNAPQSFYKIFYIPKKNGEVRTISEPLTSLKEIQSWILKEILYKCKVSSNAKAYVIGKSIRDNARFHKKQNKVLTIDIEDFFPSIKINKVIGVFRRAGYSKAVSTLLARLCCTDNGLPQGAPTSPAISNLVMYYLDMRIFGFCRKRAIRYTRYADDLTFSGDFDDNELISFTRSILERKNLFINNQKTRLRKRHQQQEVTGVVVNEKLQVPRDYRERFRQELYFIKKYGLVGHVKHINAGDPDRYIRVLIGKANFISQINPNDTEIKDYLKILYTL
ncbi:retron St85 family RNA-directed DNA polymerase [Spirosoma endophyticum]|uniref:RNA-directed DNA polymerase n=1 Tax=Spirosoma endophyticum TaxID=662367 RepID=A0A1I2E5E7_9BACT|nr:retron St85 family RNA-directed DNA polymerase [Spirosoma endophyticum]SFE87846.1 RNA-directed DNA polymerase [Spirosoma endophyticum]